MTPACAPVLTATVESLFQQLNRRGVRYAVLRNYECFPALDRDGDPTARTDIDLVVDPGDMPVWREVARSVAEQEAWDVLTECDHWTQSAVRQHHIKGFRFYRLAPLEFIQVDVFHHGYVLCGLPVFDLQELLMGRVASRSGRLTHIDPMRENIVRLLKVAGLSRGDQASNKLARYREKLIRFWTTEQGAFRKHLRAKFFVFGEQAVRALQRGDMMTFARKMRWATAWFVATYALSHPVHAPRCFVSRAQDNRRRFLTRQCGCAVNVYAPDEPQRRLVRAVMDEMEAKNVFADWSEKDSASGITIGHRAVMEQGGLIIQWSDRGSARIDMRKSIDAFSLTRDLVRVLVERDKILFLRSGAL